MKTIELVGNTLPLLGVISGIGFVGVLILEMIAQGFAQDIFYKKHSAYMRKKVGMDEFQLPNGLVVWHYEYNHGQCCVYAHRMGQSGGAEATTFCKLLWEARR